jgi:hypothetical protein
VTIKLTVGVILLLAALGAAPQGDDPHTWKGRISDSVCGVKHEPVEGMPMTDKECTLATVRGGSKFVFVLDDTVYPIANQDHPDLVTFAGDTVKLTGRLKDKVITVTKIEAADMEKGPGTAPFPRQPSVRSVIRR